MRPTPAQLTRLPRGALDGARSVVLLQFLHQKLPRGVAIVFLLLAGDAHLVSGLYACHISHKAERLLIALTLELEAVCSGYSTAGEAVAMMKGVEDADPEDRASSSNTTE